MKNISFPELRLDPAVKHDWEGQLHGYLWAIRNWELANLDSRMKKDRSASISDLAKRIVITRTFPCHVVLHEFFNYYVIGFRLHEKGYGFHIAHPDKITQELLVGRSPWNTTYDHNINIVWLRFQKEKRMEYDFLYPMLERAVESMTRSEIGRLLKLREQTLDDIGFHDITLKVATGEPDIRMQAVSRMINNEMRAIEAIDLVEDIKVCSKLVLVCPIQIEQVMQRARLLYTHAYNEWEFFTMSVHYAVLALEASFRSMYDAWLGHESVRVEAIIQGTKCVEVMQPRREEIFNWSNKKKALSVMIKGLPLPRSKSQLMDHAVKLGILSLWERERCEYLLWLRDEFSHPTGTFIEWISWATGNIAEACLFINLLWTRFSQGAKWDVSWEDSSKESEQ